VVTPLQLKTYRMNVSVPSNGLLYGHSTSTLQMNIADIQTASKERARTYHTKDKITNPRCYLLQLCFVNKEHALSSASLHEAA
jgi:hypothetical protein